MVPLDELHPYTIRLTSSLDIHQLMVTDLSKINPSYTIPSSYGPHLPLPDFPWFCTHAKTTILLPGMNTPKQGFIRLSPDQVWEFNPGRSSTVNPDNPPIPLGTLETITPLIKSISIFARWRTASQIHGARARLITSNHVVRRMRLMQSTKVDDISNISVHSHLSNSRPPPPSAANLLTSRFGGVARHLASAHRVSATSISSRCPPRSLASHDEMSKSDAALWDEAYAEEYYGLNDDTKIWEYIT